MLMDEVSGLRAYISTIEDVNKALVAKLELAQQEVERLKRGLFEIEARGHSSRSKDYLELPLIAGRVLAGEPSSFCSKLLDGHVTAHNETRKKLAQAELQVSALIGGILEAVSVLNSGGAYMPQTQGRDDAVKALFDAVGKAGLAKNGLEKRAAPVKEGGDGPHPFKSH